MSNFPHPIPTPRTIRLGAELRKLRDAAGLTATAAAAELDYSQSWLSRAEAGRAKLTPAQVHDLVAVVYGVDEEQAESLMALAVDLDVPRWWEPLGSLRHRYLTYIGYEEEATLIRNWEQVLVSGLLQTEAYARAVLSAGWELRDGVIEERLEARMGRQKILTRQEPVHLHAIMSEAMLRCQVGGPAVHRDQLRHLCKVSDLPNLTMQVVPFVAGEPLAAQTSFALLNFGDNDPMIGLTDTLIGSWLIESPQENGRLLRAFENVIGCALTPNDSVDWIWRESWN